MRIFTFLSLTVFLALAITKTAFSDNRYWVNGTGNWNDPQQWSETPGGTPGASVPTKEDDVFFDHHSFTSNNQSVIIKEVAYCKDFRWEVDNYQPTLKSSSFLFKKWTKAEIHVHGSLIIGENIHHAFFGDIVLKSNSENIIDVESRLTADIVIDAENGAYVLGNDFNSEGNLLLKTGTLHTNDNNIETHAFIGSGTANRALYLGGSIINTAIWDFENAENIDFVSGNSTIILNNNINSRSLQTGGLKYATIENKQTSSKGTFSLTLSSDSTSCYNLDDGKIYVKIDGTPVYPVTYELFLSDNFPAGPNEMIIENSNEDSVSFEGVYAGDYFVWVVDSDSPVGKTGTTINVYEPDELLPGAITMTKGLSCFDSEDGEMQANPSGGTPPYTYQWYEWDGLVFNMIPGETNQQLSNIGQGTYQVEISDANGCGTVSAQKIFNKLFTPLYVPDEVIIDNVNYTNSCSTPNNTGTITISGSGGTGALTYAIVRTSDADSTTNSTGVFENLIADTYKIYVIDDNGCVKQGSDIIITQLANPTASIIPDNPTICPNSTIELDGNPTLSPDGSSIDSHEWTGDVSYLDYTDIQRPDFTGSLNGIFTLTYTVTDNNGCAGSDNVTVTVEDTDPPVAVCKDITVDLDATGNVTITGADIDDGSTDNCTDPSNLTLTATPNSFSCSDLGDNLVTLTVIDVSGNISTCTATVTVEDNIAPAITCPGNVTQDNDPGVCTAVVNGLAPTTTDNCSVVLQTWTKTGATTGSSAGTGINDVSGTPFNSGVTTVTYSIEDQSGNSNQCSFTVTINDTEDPTITCPGDLTANTSDDGTGDCTTTVNLGTPTTDDNCGINSEIVQVGGTTIDPLTYPFPVGVTTVTWIVEDNAGNTASCTQNVTVVDDENPNTVCNDITIQLDNTGNATITPADIDGGSTDNCGIDNITAGQTAFTCADLGTNSVLLTVTDDAGNISTCTAIVTVEDNIAPDLTCPGNVTQDNDPGVCTADVTGLAPTATDNCNVVLQTWTMSGATTGSSAATGINDISGTTFNAGVTTVTYSIEDASGNSNQCSFTVTINDTEDPTITCPGDVTANTSDDGTGDCSTTVNLGTPTTNDNCGINSEIAQVGGTTIDPLTYQFPVGVTIVTWIVEDNAGNTASCTQEVTVIDDENPAITCPGDVTAYTSDDGTGDCSTTANLGTPATDDNCGVNTVITQVGGTTIDPLTYQFPVGITTVTWIVEDDAGNTANCTQNVEVIDDENPTISCPADVSLMQDGSGSCNAVVNGLTPVTDDNCSVVLQTWTMTGATTNSSPASGINDVSGETFEIGVTTVEYYIEDASGNSATCSFTVEIYDEVEGGLIEADQDICYNSIPAELTNVTSASVCGGYTYQWEKKSGTGSWGDIPGATGESYQEINPLTEITFYTRKAISDLGYGTASSDTVTITITPAPTVFAGEDTTLCYGTPYQILDADTTYSGGISWEILTGNGSLDDVNILDPTYTPVLSDGGTTVELVLHASGLSNCNDVTDTVRITYLSELLVSIGKPSPFLIDSTSTQINVSFKISNHQYLSLIGLYLVSPLDSVIELKPICSNIGAIQPTEDMEVEFYNDPDNTSGLTTISDCGPNDGVYLFSGDWKKKLHGQDPANGSWRLMIKDSLNFGSPGILEEGEIRFGDINYEGDFESVVYAESSINLSIKGHTGSGPAAITTQALSLTGLTTSCFGLCDATAVGTASGGQPPYVLYEWSDTPDFSNIIATTDTVDLCAGTFYLRITDSHGCTAIDSVTVEEPPEIVITSDTVVHNSCYGYNDGKIALAFSGGTGTLQYTVDDGTNWYNSGDTIENLSPGEYLVIIEDVNQCSKDTLITITQPDPINVETSYTDITCTGYDDGEITITATEGTAPYEYSIDDAVTWHSSGVFTGLSEGTYYVAVQDVNGCIRFGDTIVIQEAMPMILSVLDVEDEYSCLNSNKRSANETGLISIAVSGGSGDYQYTWQSGASTIPGDEIIKNLSAGTYELTIEDSRGCEKDTTFLIGYDDTFDVELDVIVADTNVCWYETAHFTFNTFQADSIEIQEYRPVTSFSYIEVTGDNMEYDYSISRNNYFNIKAFNSYCEDNYMTKEFRYFPDRELNIVENDGIENDTIVLLGGDGRWEAIAYVNDQNGLIVNWTPTDGVANPGSLNTLVSLADSMWYAVTITTEEGGCTDTDSVFVTHVPDVLPYDGFSPNGDGINDFWYIEFIDNYRNNVVTVFNRWGTKVFEQKGYNNNDPARRWDGSAKNGKQVGSGTYYYVIILNEEESSPKTGAVTIMR